MKSEKIRYIDELKKKLKYHALLSSIRLLLLSQINFITMISLLEYAMILKQKNIKK